MWDGAHGQGSENKRSKSILPVTRREESVCHRRQLLCLAARNSRHYDLDHVTCLARLGSLRRADEDSRQMTIEQMNRRTLLALAGAGVLASRLHAAQSQLQRIQNGDAVALQFFARG